MNRFDKYVEDYENSKILNKINNINGINYVEINNNILEGISNKNRKLFINEYLHTKIQGHDYKIQNIIVRATSVTIGKLNYGRTNYDKRINKKLKIELKINVIGNIAKILEVSKCIKANMKDTKNHKFADYFDRRECYIKYKEEFYKVIFEIGKRNYINTMYGIENIKKQTNKFQKK